MTKTYCFLTIFLLVASSSFSQTKHKIITNDLPQNVIYDFAKAVNYSWYYGNNSDAFKGAIISMLRRKGIYSQFDTEKTIQEVGKYKHSRDLVLGALFDYKDLVGMTLEQLLVNMDIPANSARSLSIYASKIQQRTENIYVADKPITKTNITLIKSPEDTNPNLGDSIIFTKGDLFSESFPFRNYSDGPLTYGIITDVKNDSQNNPLEIMIYFKDKHHLKGVYDDIFFEDDKYTSVIAPEKLNILKIILTPGRKVAFRTFWIGTSAGHDVLTYLKALPKRSIMPKN